MCTQLPNPGQFIVNQPIHPSMRLDPTKKLSFRCLQPTRINLICRNVLQDPQKRSNALNLKMLRKSPRIELNLKREPRKSHLFITVARKAPSPHFYRSWVKSSALRDQRSLGAAQSK